MTETEFWNVLKGPIQSGQYDIQEHVNLIRGRLDCMSIAEYLEFVQLFRERLDELYTWDLWAVAYMVKDTGCGDSSFEDFRAAIICQGPALYKLAMEAPDDLADVPNIELFKYAGDLNFAIPNHFSEISSDENLSLSEEEAFELPRILPTTPKGDYWDEDDAKGLSARFPKSFAKWGLP